MKVPLHQIILPNEPQEMYLCLQFDADRKIEGLELMPIFAADIASPYADVGK